MSAFAGYIFSKEAGMRKSLGSRTVFYPLPVLLVGTYDEKGKPNLMNAAWGGIYDDNKVIICLSEDHLTTQNIKRNGDFTLAFADAKHVVSADYVGLVSGRTTPDKVERSGFHMVRAGKVNAPYPEELPVVLECRMAQKNGCSIIADIIDVNVDERVLDANGKVDTSLVMPISFDPFSNTYRILGEAVGKAFHDGLKLK